MDVSIYCLRPIVLVFFFQITVASAHVFETEDAIVITAHPRFNPAEIDGLEVKPRPTFRNADVLEVGERSCLTFDRRPGTCLTVSECYPYTKLHQTLGNLETWVIGTRGMCNYVEPSGKQIYGVCCHTPFSKHNRTVKLEENAVGNPTEYPDASSRIVGGWNSYNGEYPFMVGIMNNGKVYCGGSLLDDIHVLTAAHCVHRLSSQGVSQLAIIMGAADLRDRSMIIKRVHSVTRHRGFDATKLYNDIALITLDSPVKFTNAVSPVCLYDDEGVNHDGKDAVAIGWGNIRDGGPRADTLQKVTLQIKSQDDCRRSFGNRAPGGIVDHFICAAGHRKDSCAGDSGGPLMMNRGNRQCQVGIVSWGIGCATDTYGVYTRISSFAVWINRNRMRF